MMTGMKRNGRWKIAKMEKKLIRTDYDEYNATVYSFQKPAQSLPKFYAKPTQVKFWNPWTSKWEGGICYKEDLISGESGAVYTQTLIAQMAPDTIENPIKELTWISLNEEILD